MCDRVGCHTVTRWSGCYMVARHEIVNGFIKTLKLSFGQNKSSHKIFGELFSKKQEENESADVLISSAWAVFIIFSYRYWVTLCYQIENMICSLLYRLIRHQLPHDKVETFNSLFLKSTFYRRIHRWDNGESSHELDLKGTTCCKRENWTKVHVL